MSLVCMHVCLGIQAQKTGKHCVTLNKCAQHAQPCYGTGINKLAVGQHKQWQDIVHPAESKFESSAADG